MAIRICAVGRVSAERLGHFKELAAVLIQMVREKESGTTLTYEFYSTDNETRWVIGEVYRDGKALSTHVMNLTEHMGAIAESFAVESFVLWGDDVPAEIVAQFSAIDGFVHFGTKLTGI